MIMVKIECDACNKQDVCRHFNDGAWNQNVSGIVGFINRLSWVKDAAISCNFYEKKKENLDEQEE